MKKFALFILAAFFLSLSVFSQVQPGKAQRGKSKDPRTIKVRSKRAPIDTGRFVLVEGGTFNMGTDQPVEGHEGPAHKVSVNSFYLAKTETTFDDYDKFTVDTKRDSANPCGWGRGKQPVIVVSWYDALEYCNWLSEKEKLSKCYILSGIEQPVIYIDTAKGYRLPTEAEWEFAARGGNLSKGYTYAGSNNLNEVAWTKENSNGRTQPVAQKAPNELGLYDMTGNVWEWCWDLYDGGYYKTSPSENPLGPASGNYRVMRGGAWYNVPNYSRVVTRQDNGKGFKQNSVGFRVARTYFE